MASQPPSKRKKSSSDDYLKNIFKSKRQFKAVNFFKYFGCTDPTSANNLLRESLIRLTSSNAVKAKKGASSLLKQWNYVVQNNGDVLEYWTARERATERDEERNHRRAMKSQAARQQRALGEEITREMEQGASASQCDFDGSESADEESGIEDCVRTDDVTAILHSKKDGSFVFSLPGSMAPTPNKPKYKAADVDALRRTVELALSSTVNLAGQLSAEIMEIFDKNETNANQLTSLKQYPQSFQKLHELLSAGHEWLDWDDYLCHISLPEYTSTSDKVFWKIARLGLLKCHEAMCAESHRVGHERTAFIDCVIPWLPPLKLTKQVQWFWCEHKYLARAEAYNHRTEHPAHSTRYADGLGVDPKSHRELLLIECNGGNIAEIVDHNLSDSLKLVENSVFALRQLLASWKACSFENASKLSILALHVIKNRMCLTETRISTDGKRWQVIELRNAVIPTSWDDIMLTVRVLDLVATINLHFEAQTKILTHAKNEHAGLIPLDGKKTVKEVVWGL